MMITTFVWQHTLVMVLQHNSAHSLSTAWVPPAWLDTPQKGHLQCRQHLLKGVRVYTVPSRHIQNTLQTTNKAFACSECYPVMQQPLDQGNGSSLLCG